MRPDWSTQRLLTISRAQPRPSVARASRCSAARMPSPRIAVAWRRKSASLRNRRKRFFTSHSMRRLPGTGNRASAGGAGGASGRDCASACSPSGGRSRIAATNAEKIVRMRGRKVKTIDAGGIVEWAMAFPYHAGLGGNMGTLGVNKGALCGAFAPSGAGSSRRPATGRVICALYPLLLRRRRGVSPWIVF